MQLATYHNRLSIKYAATNNPIFTGSFKNWGDMMQVSVLLTLFQKMIFPIVFCLRRSKGGLPLVWPVFKMLPNPFPAKTIITITLTLRLVKMRCGSQPNLSSGECTLDFWSSDTQQEFRNWEADLKIQSFTPSGAHYCTLCTWECARERKNPRQKFGQIHDGVGSAGWYYHIKCAKRQWTRINASFFSS